SKSAGNVFTPQVWLRYGSPQSLLLLLYKRIAGTRNISIEDIPKLMDEYDMLEEHYFSNKSNDMKSIKMRGLYEYINNLKVRSASIHIPYQLLINLASLVKEDREEFVIKRLQKYGMIKEVNEELKNRIRLASNWADDFGVKRELNISLNENEINAIKGLINVLKNENDIKIIQSSIFDIAKSNNIEPKEFFRIIYNILLGSDKGPRLGNYISDMGKEKVIRELESISS
ncbi:MAG: lysine--tRNA ligase, partial [Candidatus Nitrosocaldaceae archaeon]